MPDLLILFLAAFAAAGISGAAGFGGALLLLPLLVASVGVVQAVPLLTIAQLIGNLSRAGFGFRQIHWRPVGWFLLGAVPLSVLGALSFVQLPKELVTRAIGAAILVFVGLKFFGALRLRPGRGLLLVGGGVVGFLSGLVGSAGPLGAAIFLSLGLPPVAYIASEAVTALAMHGVKTVVYQQFISLDRDFWSLAVLLGVAMVLGTWTAKRFIERMPRELFQKFVAILLVLIAGYMLIHG
ncbi:sulfite exporter TauE/SafE family protein [Thioalkalivibrio sulfidiphilus]|uniref:sulfite exporter TauE/SafE family protein n=1 Tax=Thioalkalivibrio sulfidiphilus TaxID=1033854 RepID=UPI00036E58B4|nr:sulfite exporter TauE/SafE family protein [Thioalkalivibrio sulfidiphilus]